MNKKNRFLGDLKTFSCSGLNDTVIANDTHVYKWKMRNGIKFF